MVKNSTGEKDREQQKRKKKCSIDHLKSFLWDRYIISRQLGMNQIWVRWHGASLPPTFSSTSSVNGVGKVSWDLICSINFDKGERCTDSDAFLLTGND